MSTIGDVIHDTAALVDAFTALLATQTAQEAPAIADALGARPQLAGAYDSAGNVVGEVALWVGRAHEVATVADAAVAIFGMLPYLVRGLGDAAQQGEAEIATLGLDAGPLRKATGQVSSALGEAANALGVAADAADETLAWIDPPQLGRLQSSLNCLVCILAAEAKSILPDQAGNTEVPKTLLPATKT